MFGLPHTASAGRSHLPPALDAAMRIPSARLPLIATLWLPLFACGQAWQPRTSQPEPHAWQPPVLDLRVERFGLLTATTGWVSGSNQILITSDGGA